MEILAVPLALVLVALNAFFVATEFAIVKVRPTRIEELIRAHRPGATAARHVLSHIDAYLSATQLGITLASLGLGWIGEPAFASLLSGPLALAGVVDPTWIHRISLAAAFAVITFLHIVVGELAPKSFAILQAETVALAVAYPIRLFYGLFYPAIWLLNGVANWLLRAAGLNAAAHLGDLHSEEEIKIILAQARSAGLLSASRGELLRRALSLSSKTAGHLMVPRNEVVFLDVNLTTEENLSRAIDSGHTRFPVCDGHLDDVIGIVDIRELLQAQAHHREVVLRSVATAAAYFPETMSAERLLAEFRSRRVPMVVVVDEYGGTSGIVTAADVVTAVMGELDDDDVEVIPLPGGAYEIDGVAPIEELSERLGISLHADDMRTVAGFLMSRLGRMPRAGDRVVEAGYIFQVLELAGPRVRRVRVQRESPRTGAPSPPAAPPVAVSRPNDRAP